MGVFAPVKGFRRVDDPFLNMGKVFLWRAAPGRTGVDHSAVGIEKNVAIVEIKSLARITGAIDTIAVAGFIGEIKDKDMPDISGSMDLWIEGDFDEGLSVSWFK